MKHNHVTRHTYFKKNQSQVQIRCLGFIVSFIVPPIKDWQLIKVILKVAIHCNTLQVYPGFLWLIIKNFMIITYTTITQENWRERRILMKNLYLDGFEPFSRWGFFPDKESDWCLYKCPLLFFAFLIFFFF